MSLREQPWMNRLWCHHTLFGGSDSPNMIEYTWLYHPLLPWVQRQRVVLRYHVMLSVSTCDWEERIVLNWSTLGCDHWVELWICWTLLPASRVPGCSSLLRDEVNALAALHLTTADSSCLTCRREPTHFWYGTGSLLSTEKPCGDGELAGTEGRVGGKEEGSKEGRREREEGRMEGGWKRMLLLLGDRFNHPGEKTLLKRCWGRKKNKTKQWNQNR